MVSGCSDIVALADEGRISASAHHIWPDLALQRHASNGVAAGAIRFGLVGSSQCASNYGDDFVCSGTQPNTSAQVVKFHLPEDCAVAA
eukprot:COSAG02_NODE_7579_length_2950_cov_19.547176_1_plen_87_part_10